MRFIIDIGKQIKTSEFGVVELDNCKCLVSDLVDDLGYDIVNETFKYEDNNKNIKAETMKTLLDCKDGKVLRLSSFAKLSGISTVYLFWRSEPLAKGKYIDLGTRGYIKLSEAEVGYIVLNDGYIVI